MFTISQKEDDLYRGDRRGGTLADMQETLELTEACRLTSDLLGVSIAAISLTGNQHQRIAAHVGFPLHAAPFPEVLSAHVKETGQHLEIEDASLNSAFWDHPIVAGDAGIRFMAAAPILLRPGVVAGAVCVMDRAPRTLNATQRAALERMAVVVAGLLRSRAEIEASDMQYQVLGLQSRELWRKQQLLSQTERLANIGGWEYDVQTHDVVWSDEIYRIIGMDIGTPFLISDMLSLFAEDDRQTLARAFRTASLAGGSFTLELQLHTLDGEEKWVRITGEGEFLGDKVAKIFGTFQDVTASREVQAELWKAANQDPLTGLANRACFTRECDRMLKEAAASKTGLAVMLLDLDFLKDINDTLGHEAGDRLICSVGDRLMAALGDKAIVARLGGDEYAVAMPNVDNIAELRRIGRSVIKAMGKSVRYRAHRLTLRGSFGGALYPVHGTTRKELMQAADIALYHAKAESKGSFILFEPEMGAKVNARINKVRQIRSALERGEVIPHYQPKICLRTGRVAGFEALARWVDSTGTLQAPGDSSTTFLDPEIAYGFGERMMHSVAKDIRDWLNAGLNPGRVALNVTASEISRGDFATRIHRVFQSYDVPLTHLTVEITESLFLSRRTDRIDQTLARLQKSGVMVALDDFGTGYASLTHLKRYAVDFIKIDKSFVHDLTQGREDAVIVEMVLDLARRLGIPVIAEGIETEEQHAMLCGLKCEYGQGYLFGRPMPASATRDLMRAWSPTKRRGIVVPFDGTPSSGRVA